MFGLFKRDKPRPPVSIAELHQRFAAMDRDELFRIRRMWVARYLPIWHALYDDVATAAAWDEKKRAKHVDAMTHSLERIEGWWNGERLVKARRAEIESAVSVMTHFAPQFCPGAPWLPQARLAALTMRHLLAFIYDRHSDFCNIQSAHEVYNWAELEAWWPPDTASMYGTLPPEVLRADRDAALVMVYTVVAERVGLAEEGRAVVDAAHRIVDTLGEDPGPFPVAELATRGAGNALFEEQRAQAYREFHGKERPGFIR